MTWSEVCQSDLFRGRWVALDNVRYAAGSTIPVEAEVFDADEDLAELCRRVRAADRTACAILFCEEGAPPMSVRRPAGSVEIARHLHPRRAMHH